MKCQCSTNLHYNNIIYFDSAEDFTNETAIVKKDGKAALIIIDGFIVFSFDNGDKNKTDIYDNIGGGCLTYLKRIHIKGDNYTHEYYILKRDGTFLYNENLEKIQPYKDGFFEISKDIDGTTKIDCNGKLQIPFHRKKIKISHDKYRLFDGKGYCGVFDISLHKMIVLYGKYSALLYLESKDIYLCRKYRYNSEPYIYNVLNGKGELQFSLRYDSVEILNDSFFLVYNIITKPNSRNIMKKGIYSFDGKEIFSAMYDDVFANPSQTGFLVRDNDPIDYLDSSKDVYGIVDVNGNYKKLDYEYINIIENKRFEHDGSLKKILDISIYSNEQEKPYIECSIQCPAWLELKRNDKYGIITLEKKVIVPLEYGWVECEYNNKTKELEAFKAHKGRDYIVYKPNGEVDVEIGDSVQDHLIEEELRLLCPGMKTADDDYLLDRDDVIDHFYDDDRY